MNAAFWRRHAVTLLLPILAALAVAGYFALDVGRITSREALRRDGQLLPAWRKGDIQRLSVRQPGRASLVLARDVADAGDLDYRMDEPVEGAEIDAVVVDHLLTALEFAPVLRKLEAAPEQFGASIAQVEVAMGKVQLAFEVGGQAPFPAGAHYARLTRADGTGSAALGTYVVPAELVTDLTASAHDYRSKQIVPYLSIALDAVELRTRGLTLRLERTDGVSFRIVSSGVRASRKRMDGLWAALAETRLESFGETDEERAALVAAVAAPRAVLTLFPEEGPAAVLRYGGECPGHPERVVVQRTAPTPLLGCVPREAQDGLDVREGALADRGLFALFPDELAELTATRGAVHFDLARDGSGFRRRAPDPTLLDKDQQVSLDAALAFLFVENAVLPTVKPTFAAEATLRIVGGRGAPGGGELVEVVELGRCDGVAHCARRASDGAVLLVPAAAYLRLMPTPDWMRSANLGLPTERAARIDLDCGTPQRLVQVDAGYKLELPTGFDLDQSRALELADALRRFRASGFVDPTADENATFAATHCRIGFDGADDAGHVELELGWNAARAFVLGRVRGVPGLFLADDELRALATRIHVRRTFWNDEAAIEEITVQRGSARTFVRHDAGLDARFEALAGFRADDVIHLGPARPGDGFQHPQAIVDARRGATLRRLTVAPDRRGEPSRLRFSGVDATFSVGADALADMLRAPADLAEDAGP